MQRHFWIYLLPSIHWMKAWFASSDQFSYLVFRFFTWSGFRNFLQFFFSKYESFIVIILMMTQQEWSNCHPIVHFSAPLQIPQTKYKSKIFVHEPKEVFVLVRPILYKWYIIWSPKLPLRISSAFTICDEWIPSTLTNLHLERSFPFWKMDKMNISPFSYFLKYIQHN